MVWAHTLLAVAPRKVCSMCQSSNLNCEMMVAGWTMPAATVAAPKTAPDSRVVMVSESVVWM